MKNAKREVVLFRVGDPAQEGPGALLLGVIHHHAWLPLLHDDATVHEDDLIRHITGKGHLVGDDITDFSAKRDKLISD